MPTFPLSFCQIHRIAGYINKKMTRLLKASQLLTLMSIGKSKFPSMVMRAYADDTTLLLPGNETALRRALQIF